MGQTSAEAKRQVDETRAHLQQTVQALELKTRRGLDVRRQVQENRALQGALGLGVIALAAAAGLMVMRRRRRTPAERLARRLKLDDLRTRVSDFRDDAKAWAAAQRRIVRPDGTTKPVEGERRENVLRRLVVSALEAALTAAAAGMVRRLITPPGRSGSDRAVMSKSR